MRGNWVFLRESGQWIDRSQLPPGQIHLLGIMNRHRLKFSNSDVDRLASLSELLTLELTSPLVTDQIVLQLKTLTKLKALYLSRTGITDACLPALTGMSNLSFLDLGQTRITDAGLAQLARIRSLSDRTLANDEKSAGNVAGLQLGGSRRPQLPALVLDNTPTTPAGVLKLQEALPDCNIYASHVYPGREDANLPLPPKLGSSDVEWAKWLLNDSANFKCSIRTDLDPDTPVTKAARSSSHRISYSGVTAWTDPSQSISPRAPP